MSGRYGLNNKKSPLRVLIKIHLIAAFLFLFPNLLSAIQTETFENNEVVIQYDKSLQTVANEVVRMYPSIKSELEKTFKTAVKFKPVIILIKTRKDFSKVSGNDLVVAVAIPRKNVIVIDNSKMKTHPFTLEITIKHELCHLLLHHIVEGGRLPRWLNEGIAQWVTGGVSEMIMGENKDLLKQAVLSRRFIPIETLNERFPANETSLRLAYQESKSIIEFIQNEYGTSRLLQILNHLRDGEEVNDALYKALSVSPYELESNWYNSLRKKYTWFTYLSSHLYEVLFSFAALFLIVGFIRFIIRKRAYKDEDESDIDE